MKTFSASKKQLVVLVLILATATLAYCSPFWASRPDRIGTVIDASTGAPVEGAFVMATYKESGATLAGGSSWCVMTRGMVTGKDGRFQFAYIGSRRPYVNAIKLDYFHVADWKYLARLNPSDEERKNNIYLQPQDSNNLEFLESEICDRALTREDVIANIQFEKLFHSEMAKYFPGRDLEVNYQERIKRWESLPSNVLVK